jgi:hypothetical protein
MSNLQTARELDQLKGQDLLNRLLAEHQERVKAIDLDMTRRGLGRSGIKGNAIWKSHAQRLEDYIDGRIRIRRELVSQCPELGSTAELEKLRGELEQHTAAFARAPLQSVNRLQPSVVQQNNQEAQRLNAHARLKIEMLKRETAIAPPAMPTAGSVSVSTGGGPAIVNLGSIFGSVQQVIGTLDQAGQVEIASVLKDLAEAITKASGLGDDRRTYLEQVRFIAEQAAAAAESRQTSVVRAVFESLRARLQDVASLAQVLVLTGPALARHFGLPWPF